MSRSSRRPNDAAMKDLIWTGITLVLLTPAASTESVCSEDEPPRVVLNGVAVERPISQSFTLGGGRVVRMRPLLDELQLTYVHNLISPDEVEELIRLASARNGWARSPLKSQGSGSELTKDDRRNSSSCALLWPLVYAGRRDALAAANPALLAELDLVERLTERVAELFTASGMELSAQYIEPLQLVRYQPSEHFGPHRDYHEYGPDGKLGSSVQGEQRAFTVLAFGTTLGAEAGGETHFPLLDVAVTPRRGDALVWANVDADGEPNPRSLHQGRPPHDGASKTAINIWIADRPFDLASGSMDRAVRMGDT